MRNRQSRFISSYTLWYALILGIGIFLADLISNYFFKSEPFGRGLDFVGKWNPLLFLTVGWLMARRSWKLNEKIYLSATQGKHQ